VKLKIFESPVGLSERSAQVNRIGGSTFQVLFRYFFGTFLVTLPRFLLPVAFHNFGYVGRVWSLNLTVKLGRSLLGSSVECTDIKYVSS